MAQLSYILERKPLKPQYGRYRRPDLELMTTFQLREICRREKIIHAVMDRMDKEELIRMIMRFRGQEESLLIKEYLAGGWERVGAFLKSARLVEKPHQLLVPARITVWRGLDTNWKDGFYLPNHKGLDGTNALVVGGDRRLCAIMNVEAVGSRLCFTRSRALECGEDITRNYAVYLLSRDSSDLVFRLYNGEPAATPLLEVYKVPILDFQVKEPQRIHLPLAIDFGTSNTAAGIYADAAYYEKVRDGIQPGQINPDAINYVEYLPDKTQDGPATPLLPTVVGVRSIQEDQVDWVFGREAQQLAKRSYIDQDFTVFYDIKRWIGDYEAVEELTDLSGNRKLVKRKEIMKAFLDYVIQEACQRFKCRFDMVYMSCPVKQKKRFIEFYQDVLSDYAVETADILDEGVSVLYHTISSLIDKENYLDGEPYRALIIDCGGGTTDLSSCIFSIKNLRVSYEIQIRSAYENGVTNFGGNNLTWRVMQLLKLLLANRLIPGSCRERSEIIASFEKDLYRLVDDYGTCAVYGLLDEEYGKAEDVIPTRFKNWEHRDRKDYYKVKNNFYFLFGLAEQVKKKFFSEQGLLSLTLTSDPEKGRKDGFVYADKWKLSLLQGTDLRAVKELPDLLVSIYEVQAVMKANVYGIVRQFLEQPYANDELQDYAIIKLTGQSCKIPQFRECLKEFIPGRMIQFSEPEKRKDGDYTLKLTCLDGAIRYIMDKKFGYAKVELIQEPPKFPYLLTGFTHTGREVTLIHSMSRARTEGSISRTLESTALQLMLKDVNEGERYRYSITCSPKEFRPVTYEGIAQKHRENVSQDDVDNIINGEVKYFVWADPDYWGFVVLPILREKDQLKMGEEQFIPFENDHWVTNYFDGMR